MWLHSCRNLNPAPEAVIKVLPGTYKETVYIDKDKITLFEVIEQGKYPVFEGEGLRNDAVLYSGNGVTVENLYITHYKGNAVMGQAGNELTCRYCVNGRIESHLRVAFYVQDVRYVARPGGPPRFIGCAGSDVGIGDAALQFSYKLRLREKKSFTDGKALRCLKLVTHSQFLRECSRVLS